MTQPWPAFRSIPYMGVIHVVAEAAKLGFVNGHPDWCNLGQGQPEVGVIEGAPARLNAMQLEGIDHAYGPVGGTHALRQAVADHYNRLFRRDHQQQYQAANVAIAAGGRLALSRLLSALSDVRLGYQTPDYTAYEDMLAAQSHRVMPVHIPTTARDDFKVTPDRLAAVIREQRLNAHLLSNPCNPTGQLLQADELDAYVSVARRTGCVLLLDEFYSHFIYAKDGSPGAGPISAAQHVGDIERDPVVIIDGLTKNFRYPGWRVGWIVGPSDIIEQVTRAASSIDGGPPATVQRAALEVLEPARADQETAALRATFARKRKLMLDVLTKLGVRVPHKPRGTFYIWGDISDLPAPYNDAESLFRAALERKVMVVPGRFFDVNPGGQRTPDSSYEHWVRFSFGPPEQNMQLGLSRLQELLRRS
jgi:aspartate/methionine/tyrosine aminotransferase